jgi:hypothetical protein
VVAFTGHKRSSRVEAGMARSKSAFAGCDMVLVPTLARALEVVVIVDVIIIHLFGLAPAGWVAAPDKRA